MKLIDAKGNRIRLKENEKVMIDIEENEEFKDNLCDINFTCIDNLCCYYIMDHDGLCKYQDYGECVLAVARTNAMVMKLKSLGFKHVKLEVSE